jgi:C1A family cysteine protease
MDGAQFAWEVSVEPIDAAPRLGYLPSRGVPPLEQQEEIAREMASHVEQALSATAQPELGGCDLRDRDGANFITPIRDQGACGSCVAFGCCAAVEGTFRLEQNDPSSEIDLSEAQLFYCVAAAEGRKCSGPKGGWYPKAALDTFQSQGVPDEACFPYAAGNQPCAACTDWESRATRISEWVALDRPEEMKDWICSRGPVVASMRVYEDFQHYAGGVYKYVDGKPLGGHCVSIVGYDDGSLCWIAKNSWGTRFGEQGFFRIGFGECGIDSGMLGVAGVRS